MKIEALMRSSFVVSLDHVPPLIFRPRSADKFASFYIKKTFYTEWLGSVAVAKKFKPYKKIRKTILSMTRISKLVCQCTGFQPSCWNFN